jgi:hypothetical protein
MARQGLDPRERWPKTLKGEMENNSRKPRDLVGKKKKGDDVADDEDDNEVRTNVS